MSSPIDLNGTTRVSEAKHVLQPCQDGGKEHGDKHLQFLATILKSGKKNLF